MTSAPAIRQAVFASLLLGAILVSFSPNHSRAEGPIVAPCELLWLDANDSSGRNGQDGAAPAATPIIDPATTGENTLTENGWDFTDPDRIPGFASVPHPVLSDPEIAD